MNRQGITLVETLLASALVMGVALASTSVVELAQRGVRSSTSRSDAALLESKIKLLLENPVLCKNALKLKDPIEGTSVAAKFDADQSALQPSFNQILIPSTQTNVVGLGTSVGGYHVQSLALQRIEAPQPVAGEVGHRSTLAELAVTLEPAGTPQHRGLGLIRKELRIPLQILTDSGQNILSCSSSRLTMGTCSSPGEVVKGFHPDGTLHCERVAAQSACAANEVLSTDDQGRIQCKSIASLLNQHLAQLKCTDGKTLVGFKSDGTANCQPINTMVGQMKITTGDCYWLDTGYNAPPKCNGAPGCQLFSGSENWQRMQTDLPAGYYVAGIHTNSTNYIDGYKVCRMLITAL